MKIRKRKHLFLHQSLIRGRYLKDDAPDGIGGGATAAPAPSPTPIPANTTLAGGNSTDAGSGESGNNNAGAGFDVNTFWSSQGSGESGSPDSESANGDQSGSDTSELRDTLTERLNSLSFGEPVMTQEIFEAAQGGDFSGFQTAFNDAMSQAVRQSLGLSVSVLRPFAEQLMGEVRSEIASTLGQRDDSSQLTQDFPAAKDANVRKMIQPIFDQALKNTKGDRTLAVKQVKEMMRLMTGATADDLGLNVAPRSADDSGRPPNRAVNWLDELSARQD